MKSLLASFAGRLTYADTVELLELSTGLRVEEFSAEQIVASVGQQLRTLSANPQAAILAGEAAPAAEQAPGRLYVAMDGTYAHIDGGWQEVKTAVTYGGVVGKEGLDTATAAEYLAAQETAEAFAERVYCALWSGSGQARRKPRRRYASNAATSPSINTA